MPASSHIHQNFPDNVLYETDNLDVLKGMNSETIHLIAADPPFNTGTKRSGKSGSYTDRWRWAKNDAPPLDPNSWNEVSPNILEEVREKSDALHQVITASSRSRGDDTAAYLCYLGIRLIEMHRVLASGGSLYLHCDHSISPYIRIALDSIFGAGNFHNEIVWKRTQAHNNSPRYGNITDSILYYTKGKGTWNKQYHMRSDRELGEYRKDSKGRSYKTNDLTAPDPHPSGGFEWRGTTPPSTRHWAYTYKKLEELWEAGRIKTDKMGRPLKRGHIQYLDEMPPGPPLQNLWTDIERVGSNARERTGSPDQKPLAIYERIILTSSNPGEVVMTPFAGSGTVIIAARKHDRRWVGIDPRPDTRFHIARRMLDMKIQHAQDAVVSAAQPPNPTDWATQTLLDLGAHHSTTPPIRTDLP